MTYRYSAQENTMPLTPVEQRDSKKEYGYIEQLQEHEYN